MAIYTVRIEEVSEYKIRVVADSATEAGKMAWVLMDSDQKEAFLVDDDKTAVSYIEKRGVNRND